MVAAHAYDLRAAKKVFVDKDPLSPDSVYPNIVNIVD